MTARLPDDLRLPLARARRALRKALTVDLNWDRWWSEPECDEYRELLADSLAGLRSAVDDLERRLTR